MSDASSEFKKLERLNGEINRFCSEREWDQFHTPKEMAIGLITESAELLEIFRFKSEVQSTEILKDPNRREHVADELADALFFILRFADRTGISLADALESKMAKNASKYPVETARGSNRKYNED